MKLSENTIANLLLTSFIAIAISLLAVISASNDEKSARSMGLLAATFVVKNVMIYDDLQVVPETVRPAVLAVHKIASAAALKSGMDDMSQLARKAEAEETGASTRKKFALGVMAASLVLMGYAVLCAAAILRGKTASASP
jgi:hypothetical protein